MSDNPEKEPSKTSRTLLVLSMLLLAACLAMHLRERQVRQSIRALEAEKAEHKKTLARLAEIRRGARNTVRTDRVNRRTISSLLMGVREVDDFQLEDLEDVVWVERRHEKTLAGRTSVYFYVPEGTHRFLGFVNPDTDTDLRKPVPTHMHSGIDYQLAPNSVYEAQFSVQEKGGSTCCLSILLFDGNGKELAKKTFDIENKLENASFVSSRPAGSFKPYVREFGELEADSKQASERSTYRIFMGDFYHEQEEKKVLVNAFIESTGPILVDCLRLNPRWNNRPELLSRLKVNPDSPRYLIYGGKSK